MTLSSSRRLFVVAAMTIALTPILRAKDFPEKPLRLMVGYGAGGMDVSARLLSERLATLLGQPVVVENRPGASGMIAAEAVARAPADGYTLLLGESGLLSGPHLQKAPIDPLKAFVPVAGAFIQPSMIIAGNDIKSSNPKEFIALLKANPGRYYFATSGVATPNCLGFEMMKAQTGAVVTHVPYRGAGQIVTAVMAGDVPIGVMSAVAALPYVRAGRVRAIALMNIEKLPGAEDIPRMADALPGFNVSATQFVLAPAGTPAAIVERLSQAIRTVITSPELAEVAAKQGNIPWPLTSSELGVEMKRESDRWAKVIKEQKLQPDQ